ncbi:MAG TPA: cyclic nucleotide-binding domain-containing protein [Legionella sp.]|nr:cyclic nucleotide-binding domain-containing protein [Legionella sp.]
MLIIEKVFLLKSVDLFADISEERLIGIAEVIEEELVTKDQVIFHKGEEGNNLYLIKEGLIRIHDGDHELACLGSEDFFGEMSLLSSEKRTASATAVLDSVLLKLNQWQFYELLETDVSILKGIVQTLCGRLARQNKMINELRNNKTHNIPHSG